MKDKLCDQLVRKSFLLILVVLSVQTALAQGTSFTYQGKLTDAGSPANGQYDMQYKLFDAGSGGAQQGDTVTVTNLTVTAGIFAVQLDFGACPTCFDGSARFLEIAVKKTTDSTYATLSPRQPLTSNPYAIRSLNATTADGLSVACVNCVTSSQIASVNGSTVTGQIPVASVPSGSGSYIQNQNASAQSGDFNISGTGTANAFNAVTQFNVGGHRVLTVNGGNVTATGVGPVPNSNTFGGVDAGASAIPSQTNAAGNFNTFFGVKTGMNTAGTAPAAPNDGCCNSFFGNLAGLKNTTGHSNAFVGGAAGIGNTTGSFNSFFGDGAGTDFYDPNVVRTGSLNTFIGSLSGGGVTTGSSNTFVGANTSGTSALDHATVIGADASVSTSNAIVLGRSVDTVQVPGGLNIAGSLTANIYDAATEYNLGGQRVLSNAGTFNLFAGVGAGTANTGVQNSFFGSLAGQNNTSGISNAFFGSLAGQNNTASANSFFGAFSGRYNTTGIQNAFFGYQAGILNHTGCCNAFFGFDAGLSTNANDNSFFGNNAGQANTSGTRNSFFGSVAGYSNQTGSDNSFFGVSAGQNNTASFNTFVGSSAGLSNTSGGFNSFFGYLAGLTNTTQHDNTFIGNGAGRNNGTNDTNPPTANWNTFVGSNAGLNTTTGCCNAFVGQSAGFNNTSASFNSFFGDGAGRNTTTGCCNVFSGQSAGLSNNTGSGNTLFGTSADVGADNLTNATAIGNRALVSQSNSLVLGSINGMNGAVADTKVGIGTATPGFKLHVAGHTNSDWPIIKLQNVDSGGHSYWLYAGAGGTNSDFGIYDETVAAYRLYINGGNGNVGINTAPIDRLDVFGDIRVGAVFGCVRDRLGTVIAGTCGSDARLKRDVTPFPRLLEKLVQLRPVHFYWRAEEFPERHFGTSQSFGLVAQEVEKVIPELVAEDEQGYKVVHYQKLPLLMLQAMKELKEENDSFRQQIKDRQRQAASQQDAINKQQTIIEDLKKLVCQDHPQAEICK